MTRKESMGCPAAGYAMGQNARKDTAPNPAKTTKNLPRKPRKAGKTQFWGNVQKAAGYAAPDSLATAVSPTELRRASLGSLWLWLWLSEESALEALSAFMRLS